MLKKITKDEYPNEHAFRMISPDKFKPESYRRKNIDKGVDIIIGKLKGDDKMKTQAYRFDVKHFTFEQAKKWMKEHDVKAMLEEKAAPKKEAKDEKEIDQNDFWLIKDNPLSKVGVFPYLGSQISDELEPDKIYQVYRSEKELNNPKTLDSFKLIPLVNEHTMLGNKEGMTPAEKKGVHGVTGGNVTFDGNLIKGDLKIFSEQLKDEIENGKRELSMGYFCDYELAQGEYNGVHYDAIQKNIRGNHVALVDEGRMGHDVRVMDKKMTFDSLQTIKEKTTMAKLKKAMDEKVDKREAIKEVMAIAAKPDSDFEGGENEKIETIAKILEKSEYSDSETSRADDEDLEEKKTEDSDELEIEEKDCKDEDPEKKEGEDEDKTEKDCKDEDPAKEGEDDEEEKAVSMDAMIKEIANRDYLVSKVSPLIGDNVRYSRMSTKQVAKYACDKLDIKVSKGHEMAALKGYLKAVKPQPKYSLDEGIYNNSKSDKAFETFMKGAK